LLRSHSQSVHAQIDIGVKEYKRHFGCSPKGIWLPESAYFEGVDKVLADNDIRYFIVDTHGLRLASPPAVYDVYSPIFTTEGVAVFARDPESSKQVWSSKEGYPGDEWYREFYRDIGYDLPYDYIKDFISPVLTSITIATP
jgi:1,4-alpha-glucan branching enzyme